jgi:hypothetical protein
MTIFIDGIKLFHPLVQFSRFLEFEIRRELFGIRSRRIHKRGSQQE